MIAFWIILYIIIACVVGCFLYVQCEDAKDFEIGVIYASIFWPASIITIILYFILKYICNKLISFFTYLKTEGFHYCKEDIELCCGQCKYIQYCNNHDEINQCIKRQAIRFSSNAIPCRHFKKYWLWRFKIRYKWDEKAENK